MHLQLTQNHKILGRRSSTLVTPSTPLVPRSEETLVYLIQHLIQTSSGSKILSDLLTVNRHFSGNLQPLLHRLQSLTNIFEIRPLFRILYPTVLDAPRHQFRAFKLRRIRSERNVVRRVFNAIDDFCAPTKHQQKTEYCKTDS
jgi:hypothetical protein